MTAPTDRLKEIRERLERACSLEAERHYSLESGCDSWVELKEIYRNFTSYDIAWLLAELEQSRRELDDLRMNSVSLRDRDKDVQRLEAAFKGRIAEVERERDDWHREHDLMGKSMGNQLTACERERDELREELRESETVRCSRIRDLSAALAASEARAGELFEALCWCSGASDFQENGQAYIGWQKVVKPLIQRDAGKRAGEALRSKGGEGRG